MALRSYELDSKKIVMKSVSGDVLSQTSLDTWTTSPIEGEVKEKVESSISSSAIGQSLANEILQDVIQQQEFEKSEEYDPKELEKASKPKTDYRSLLDPIPAFKLSLEEQYFIKMQQLVPSFNDVIIQADSERRFAAYEPHSQLDGYYEGVCEALKDVLETKLLAGNGMECDLYKTVDELKQKSETLANLFTDEENNSENKFARAYHEGLTAGYLNSFDMIEERLAEQEQWRFKGDFTPTVGGN